MAVRASEVILVLVYAIVKSTQLYFEAQHRAAAEASAREQAEAFRTKEEVQQAVRRWGGLRKREADT